MKRKWLGLALAAAVACAGTAWADILAQDSAANYGEENPFVNGANGGSGFAGWEFPDVAPELADSSAGACGNVNSANGLSFRVARDAGNDWCHAYRNFNSLNPGDVLSLKFSCAWDGGGRGIDLFAADGQQIANAVNLSPSDNLSVCGETASTEYGGGSVYDLVLTQEADGIALSLTRTSPDSEAEPFVYETKISTDKKLSRIGFYAGGWGWSEADLDNYALFVNDLKIEGTPPTDTLSLTPPDGDAWQVLSASEELEFTVSRTGTEGDLEVALASSYPEFVSVPATVTIADGKTSATFPVTVTLQGPGNDASISASATGVTGADYGLHGPQYRISAVENVDAGAVTNFWVDWDNNGVRDDSKLTLAIEPEGADFEADAPETWTWNDKKDEDGNLVGAWVEAQFTAYESARMVLKFDGVEMWGANVTVAQAGATFSGPTALHTGKTGTYVLDVTLPGGMTDAFELVAEPAGLVAITPSGEQTLEASDKIEFAVEALAAGDVTLTVKEAEDGLGLEIAGSPITVSITDYTPPSYDDYVAYDEASLYEGSFDFASTGAGKEGFGAWQVVRSGAEFGNVDVGGGDAGMPSILSDDGKALFLYGNRGEDPSYAVVRPFANTLQPGQKASVEFVASEAGGSRVVRFVRIEESGIHNRFEIWNNSGAIGINVDGVETAINWPNGLRRVEASIELAADGSSYTLELLGHNPGSDLLVDDIYQHVVNSDIGYWGGGIQGLYFEGTSTEGDLVFNRLAIEQVAEPTPPPPPAVTMALSGVWNPDEVGVPYEFTLTPSEVGAIGLVDLSLDGEGAELSAAQVDLTEGAATFTFTLTGETLPAGDTFKITASAVDVDVEDATYDITVWEPSTMLVVVNGEYEYDYVAGGTVEFWLYGTPKFVGQQADLDSGNEGILAPPSPAVATVVPYYTESDEAKFAYTMVGAEEGQVWVHATKDEAEWGYAGITINGKAAGGGDVVPVKKISIKDGEMTLTLDGKGSQVFGATEVKDGGWVWQALDLAIIGDGTSVSLPMDAPKMMFKVE